MTPKQFAQALLVARMRPHTRTSQACRLVLVEGMSHREAARQVGVQASAVNRAVRLLQPRPRCPTCGALLAHA